MGRHSSSDQGHFYRSFFGWVGLWAMIAVVTGIAVWFVVGLIAGGDAQDPLAADSRPQQVAEPETDTEPEPEPEPTVSGARIVNESTTDVETPAPAETQEPKEKDDGGKLITEGVSIQVLNGTTDPAAAQAMGDKLSGLGYSVVAIEESSVVYDQTTVFWSTEASKDAAVALAERFGWLAEPKPTNLADTVSLHVVVGADES